MPTKVTYVCDPSGATPGSELKISDIVALLSAEPLDWVAEDKTYEILLKGPTPLLTDFINGPDTAGFEFVTDETHCLTIKAHPGHGHRGVFDARRATILADGGAVPGLTIGLPHTRLEGLIIDAQGAANGGFGTGDAIVLTNYSSDAEPVFIDRCLVRVWSETNVPVNVFNLDKGDGHKITNCAAYCSDSAGNMVRIVKSPTTPDNTVEVYNSTFVNLSTVVGTDACMVRADGGDVITQNCYFGALDSDVEVYVEANGGAVTKGANDATYNAEAVTAGLRNIAPNTALFGSVVFVPTDASVGDQMDLHIKSGCALHNAGGVLAAITTDYEGQARAGTLDIGADELGLAPPPNPTIDTFVIDPVNGPITTMQGDAFTVTDLYGYLTDLGYNFDLAAANKIVEVLVKGRITPVSGSAIVVGDSAGLGFFSFFTDADHYVIVKPYPGFEHAGIYDESKALLDATDNTPAIDLRCPYTRVEGLVVNAVAVPAGAPHGNGGFDGGIVLVGSTDSHATIDGLLIKITPSTDTPVKVFRCTGGHGTVIKNCLAYVDASVNSNFIFVEGPASATYAAVGVVEVYNNTVVNLSSSSHASAKFIFSKSVNSVFFGRIICDNNYFGALAGSNIEVYVTEDGDAEIVKGDNDATYNTEAVTVGLRSIVPSMAGFKKITFATANFHLKNNSVLKEAGATLGGVTTDFEGNTRETPYDIGADELTMGLFTLIQDTNSLRQTVNGVTTITIRAQDEDTAKAIAESIDDRDSGWSDDSVIVNEQDEQADSYDGWAFRVQVSGAVDGNSHNVLVEATSSETTMEAVATLVAAALVSAGLDASATGLSVEVASAADELGDRSLQLDVALPGCRSSIVEPAAGIFAESFVHRGVAADALSFTLIDQAPIPQIIQKS